MWRVQPHQNFSCYQTSSEAEPAWLEPTKLTGCFHLSHLTTTKSMYKRWELLFIYIFVSFLLKEPRFLLMEIMWRRSLIAFIRTKYNVHTAYKRSSLQEHFADEILVLLPWTTWSDCGRNNCKNKSSCFNSCRNNYPSTSRLNKAAIYN